MSKTKYILKVRKIRNLDNGFYVDLNTKPNDPDSHIALPNRQLQKLAKYMGVSINDLGWSSDYIGEETNDVYFYDISRSQKDLGFHAYYIVLSAYKKAYPNSKDYCGGLKFVLEEAPLVEHKPFKLALYRQKLGVKKEDMIPEAYITNDGDLNVIKIVDTKNKLHAKFKATEDSEALIYANKLGLWLFKEDVYYYDEVTGYERSKEERWH